MEILEKKEISFTKEEFNYLKNLLNNFSIIESKIPKGMKTEKSIILKELNNRFQKICF